MKAGLGALKINRFRQVDSSQNDMPFLQRATRKYRQLSQHYPRLLVWFYFAERCIFKLASMGSCVWFSLRIRKQYGWLPGMGVGFVASKGVNVAKDDPSFESVRYAIHITGGIGDALVIARLVRDIQHELDDSPEFDVFFHSPKLIEFIYRSIPGFRRCLNSEAFQSVAPYYTFALRANQFVTFINEYINYRLLVKNYPEILVFFGNVQAARKSIEKYIQAHPMLDGAFADTAVRMGKRRCSYLHEMIGVPYGGDRLSLPVDWPLLEQYGLSRGSYITVHDGWDNAYKLVAQRPTKAVPFQMWVDIVALLKRAKPSVKIIQIGAKTGMRIPSVDLCLKNELTFEQSASLLAGAALHLDSESGLVHLASSLGVRCVVMFGPTNVEWFGYPSNINIAPRECGNCWWSTDSWMDICPIGQEQPACTSNIDVTEVVKQALGALEQPHQPSGLSKIKVVAE